MKRATKSLTLDQLDELHVIQCCLAAVADLMVPERDLHAVNRDNLALLLGYFSARLLNNTAKTLTLEQLDQIDDVQCHLSTVADLMSPCTDMHLVNRDKLATLLGYFTDRMSEVTRGSHAGK